MEVNDKSNDSDPPSIPASNIEQSMYCWGQADNGVLGLGNAYDNQSVIITPVASNFPHSPVVKYVSCGRFHTLLITEAGQVYSCGNNEYGQLGHDKDNKLLNQVTGLSQYVISHVTSGQWHSLALNDCGELFTWGADTHGQLGLETLDNKPVPSPRRVKGLASITVVQACAGYSHCLVLTNTGELYSWGNNEYGQIGTNSSSPAVTKPTRVESLVSLPIASIFCGANHSFVLSKSGAVYGWGKNTCGQLGLNDEQNKFVPNHLKSLRSIKVKYISCGEEYSVFLTQEGGVFTCGDGSFGQLGHGTLTNELLPRKVLELMGSTVTQIACGRRHTLTFIPSVGRLYAFGIGSAVQLESPKSLHKTPTLIAGPWIASPVQSTAAKTENGTEVTQSKPGLVVKKIFSGGDHSIVTVTKSTDAIMSDDFRLPNPSSEIMFVDYDKLKQCEREVEQLKPDETLNQDLLLYLETVFLSPGCMNGSFLQVEYDEHYNCNTKNPGVNMKLAQDCFDTIARIERESVRSLILFSHAHLVKALWVTPPDTEALRMFLTLPLYHEFMNPRQHEILQIPFAGALLNLKTEATKILGNWYLLMSNDYFERLILIYKQCLLYLLAQPNVVDSTNGDITWNRKLSICLQVLAKLNTLNNQGLSSNTTSSPSSQYSPAHSLVPHTGNKVQPNEGRKVPYTAFYIPDLHTCCDIRADYFRWIAGRPNGTVRDFLCNYPFIFDAKAKTTLLEMDQRIQMDRAMNSGNMFHFLQTFNPLTLYQYLDIEVSRDNLVEDTIRELAQYTPNDFKKPLRVKFTGEEAEDAGGVRREFLMLLLKEILDPKYGMFKEYEETRSIWFSEESFEDQNMYYLIGTLCGLAIYNFTIINVPFPLALYKKILDEPILLQDLKDLSPTIARSLQDILDYREPDLEDVFSVTFSISRELYGATKVVPLKENGANIPVTLTNKQEFVDLYLDFVMNRSVDKQFAAYKAGFLRVCGSTVLKLFHAQELMAVVIGNENYDWEELERQAEYKNGYTVTDATIRLFWSVFHELTQEEKKKFLLYLTGSDRVPIKGMSDIKIYIQPVPDDRRLPVAHTCVNLLDLPRYGTKERLRYKLLQAIQQTQVFSLV
uniref:Probable E3 ubiquitin-protein ligase HERC4 n=2 Tax=Cacopsylla melanoneura TaxID=428564 RepID=A0A8D9ALL9_9HEMI